MNLSGTGRKQFTYDAETKAWTASDLNAGPSGRNFVRFIGGEAIAYASNYAGNATALYSSAVTKDAYTNYAGLYLGSGNVLKWVAAGSFTLANSLGEFPLTGFSGYLYSALMLDGKMFAADGEGNYKFYDFDKFFGTPREIGSGNSTLVKDNYPVMFATVLEAGDYFICNRGSKQNNYEPTELAIFKIGENYALEEADDLQTDLQALTGQVCSVQYNNDTKLLTAAAIRRCMPLNGMRRQRRLTI